MQILTYEIARQEISPKSFKRDCLGLSHSFLDPKCLQCGDFEECLLLKKRWERKTIKNWMRIHGVTKCKPGPKVIELNEYKEKKKTKKVLSKITNKQALEILEMLKKEN